MVTHQLQPLPQCVGKAVFFVPVIWGFSICRSLLPCKGSLHHTESALGSTRVLSHFECNVLNSYAGSKILKYQNHVPGIAEPHFNKSDICMWHYPSGHC